MAYLDSVPWVLVDVLRATNSTSAVFGAAGDSVRQYPINGNLDLGYKMTWGGVCTVTGSGINIRLNSAATNQIVASSHVVGGGAGGDNASQIIGIMSPPLAVNDSFTGDWVMEKPATGTLREAFFRYGSGNTSLLGEGVGRFQDTVTNITSIQLLCLVGQRFTGTVRLYVKNPQRPF